MVNLRTLISGSDVRGKALGDGAVLTDQAARRIGEALVAYLRQQGAGENPRVLMGRDPRLTGESLMESCAMGMKDAGGQVTLFGLCTTPAMFVALKTPGFEADASVMVTASHHPWDRNGLKFFLPDGGISTQVLEAILDLAQSQEVFSRGGGSVCRRDFLPVYADILKKRVTDGLHTDVLKPLLGLHVVVDAGNGSGGFYAKLLEDMGAWVEGSQFLEPDGHFPNHIPNPENPEAMASVSQAVVRAEADLGVIFDADCDRAAIVDKTGREINRNRLIALISAILLDQKSGLTIVTDSVTSSGLARFIGEWGGVHYRYKRGYHNVIEEARRLNEAGIDCPLAIETSGHAALRENGFLDDGMYLVTVLICEAMKLKQEGRELSSLISDLKEPLESAEVRLNITDPDFRAAGKAAIERVMDYAFNNADWHIAPDNREGVRISFDLNGEMDSGWFLLRLSVHDPVLPLNMESDVRGGLHEMAAQLYQVLQSASGVDVSPLKDFITTQEA
ncbi:MAG: phosphomannomutase/phosphoglucomutase [Clostridiales bacterium]|nr:phosphomannomutase/phosphoglucomutase [Clostridiales bacterium]